MAPWRWKSPAAPRRAPARRRSALGAHRAAVARPAGSLRYVHVGARRADCSRGAVRRGYLRARVMASQPSDLVSPRVPPKRPLSLGAGAVIVHDGRVLLVRNIRG